MKAYLLLVALFALSLGTGLAQNVDIGDVGSFIQNLEQDGFTVQQGALGSYDFMALYDAGVVPSAYGANPSTKYLTYFVPPAPGHNVPELFSKIARALGVTSNLSSFWNLGPDEAIVFVGRTPPECRYFSFDHYILDRTYGNETRWIFANIADTVNNLVINTEGTPNGLAGNPFNQTTVVVATADRGIDQRIRTAALAAGYSSDIFNTQVFPSAVLNMGSEKNSDTFLIYIRPSIFQNKQAGDYYLNSTPATVFRITPNESTTLDPYGYPELRVRGTGTTELDLTDDLEELRTAILNKYSGLNTTELQISQAVPVGIDAIQRGIDAIGPTNDACYLWTINQTPSSPTPPFFIPLQSYGFFRNSITLGNDTDEFIIVYGVNHVATGKSTYSNFVINGADIGNSVGVITDAEFNGTAEEYLPNNPNAKYLYVYKIARSCYGDPYCFELPYGVGSHGIDLDQPLFIFWRVYLEKATKTGPSYSEIVYDRAIKFDPKE
ncbi:MAG TPA: hypothetical protein PLI05_05965 [Methanotrichaceae archaeon]|nr:hypothetical protein [Methanotrichaceae archaeon]HQI91229.1 hypothetical protein [Methanotrichaceae archaeon]HQJ61723.1 hypothetical protein [Methanothrix soehngenii]